MLKSNKKKKQSISKKITCRCDDVLSSALILLALAIRKPRQRYRHVKIQKIHGEATSAIPAGRSHDGADDVGREMNITRKTPPMSKRRKSRQVIRQTHAWPDLGLPSGCCCDIPDELRCSGEPLFIKYSLFSSFSYSSSSLYFLL
jgi:hypothetical protein